MRNNGNNRRKRKPSPKGKGDRYEKKENSKVERTVEGDRTTCGDKLGPLNDFSWYDHNPNLTVAAASVPFPYRPGMDMLLGKKGANAFLPYQIPGVMALRWAPAIGQSSQPTDPASIAAKEVFAQVRWAFSGSIEADPPDFIMYFLALDSIFSYVGALKRVYRILNTYTPENYAVPDVVLCGLGLGQEGITALKTDRMKLFQVINELIGMTRKFRCPAVFDIFNRHYWMNDNVYTDAESANSQMYVFREDYYLKFSLQKTPDDVEAGGLEYVASPINRNLTDVDTLYEFGRELINALASSDDAYIISGYLKRAYEDAPIFAVDELRLDENFAPVYVPEVLAQIENSRTIQEFGGISLTTQPISQDPKTNSILASPKVQLNTFGWNVNPIMSVRNDRPSVMDVVEATRLQAYVGPDNKVYCGTEIPINWFIYTNNDIGQTGSQFSSVVEISSGFTSTNVLTIATGSQFDWSPLVVVVDSTTVTAPKVSIFGDVHNVTVCDPEVLKQIHKVCLYSEFNSFA